MKKLILILTITLLTTSCHNHINEYTIVKNVSRCDKQYKVELDFFFFNQILYTDSSFNAGDTLYFTRKH